MRFESLMQRGIEQALEIGKLLTEKKSELKHGQLGQWIRDNLIFSERTAQRYMNLFDNRSKIEGADNISEAYKMLSEKNDNVSHLEQSGIMGWEPEKWPEKIQEAYAMLNEIRDAETITGFTHAGGASWITIKKVDEDLVRYEMLLKDPENEEGGSIIYNHEPILIEALMMYLIRLSEMTNRISIENMTWINPGNEGNKDQLMKRNHTPAHDTRKKYAYLQFPLCLLGETYKDPERGLNLIISYGIMNYALKMKYDLMDVAKQALYDFERNREKLQPYLVKSMTEAIEDGVILYEDNNPGFDAKGNFNPEPDLCLNPLVKLLEEDSRMRDEAILNYQLHLGTSKDHLRITIKSNSNIKSQMGGIQDQTSFRAEIWTGCHAYHQKGSGI